jgi:hypothetical protein
MTVNITEVFPDARRIPVEEITPLHRVFDTFGGTHEIRLVAVNRRGVTIRRTDGVVSWHPLGSTITVLGGGS